MGRLAVHDSLPDSRPGGGSEGSPLPTQGTPVEFRPKPGVDPLTVDLGTLGYAEEARKSYEVFKRLKDEGVIPAGVRFQVALPTPFAGTQVWIERESREALTPAFENAMRKAVAEITDTIPAGELAIQWDVCLEVGFWDRPYFNFNDGDPTDEATQAAVTRKLGSLGDLIPAGVELGYHLCYGEWGHRHFKQPDDAGNLVKMANGIRLPSGGSTGPTCRYPASATMLRTSSPCADCTCSLAASSIWDWFTTRRRRRDRP